METALLPQTKQDPEQALKEELGPFSRMAAARYFEPVRFSAEDEAELRALAERGFVVHVLRTTAWVNFMYLVWAMAKRGLPPIRAVVNLRRWFTRPWRKTLRRGSFEVRFTYARRNHGAGLVFLKKSALLQAEGKYSKEDPFPALAAMARKAHPVFLVPELFVWEKKSARLKPSLIDRIFGSPEAPGFLHSMLAFWRNHNRAQFRVGTPIDLRKFIDENPGDSDEVIARKVKMALHHHLARETRAVFGPPIKSHSRLIEETMRDRVLRASLEAHAQESNRKLESVVRDSERNLNQIAARLSATVVAVLAPLMNWVFNRIYDGIEVDEAGLDRALKAASKGSVVICPSHKSHVDYLVMSYVLWSRGYTVPVVAAGANLSFFPLGPIFRRGGAFFLRRSFKGDKVYTATFRAYIKKLVHDGIHQEFFPEGGRSRTGKLLTPKLGLFTWEVDAILEGAAKDLYFIPVSIDYEKVVESGSYSKELAGGEKKPEDLKALLSAPKVLTENYGRIHLSFDEPVSLREMIEARGLDLKQGVTEEQKRALVRALGNRVMYGISRVSTVTPHALVAAALLSHRRRGISSREVAERIGMLRRVAESEHAPLSKTLKNAPSDPTVMGPVADALRTFSQDEMVRVQEAKGEVIYQLEDDRRGEMSFYKNTLMNLVTPRSLVANAVLANGGRPRSRAEVKESALWLSRLFKLEFIYRVGASFDQIFDDIVAVLISRGLLEQREEQLGLAPEDHSRPHTEFLADLMRDYLESYLIAALTLQEVASHGGMDRKGFVKAALETGRAEFLSGRLGAAEALSRTTLENAVGYFLDQKILVEADKKLKLSEDWQAPERREELVRHIRSYLNRRVG